MEQHYYVGQYNDWWSKMEAGSEEGEYLMGRVIAVHNEPALWKLTVKSSLTGKEYIVVVDDLTNQTVEAYPVDLE